MLKTARGAWVLAHRRWVLGAAVVLVLLTLVVVFLAAGPASRTVVIIGVSALAAVSPLVGVRLHRPRVRGPWLLVATMLGCWATAFVAVVVTGAPGASASALIVAGQLASCALVAVLFTGRHPEGSGGPGVRRRAVLRGVRGDGAVLAVVLGLVAAQVVATATRQPPGGPGWVAVVPALDVLIACLLVRFLASRSSLSTSGVVAIAAALVTVVYDLLVAGTGHRAGSPASPLGALWVLAAGLFVVASLLPSMARAFEPSVLHARRPEAARLLGLVPLAAVPVGLYLVASQSGVGVLPVEVYLLGGAVVAVLAVVRGAQALALSDHRADHDPLTGLKNRRALKRDFVALLATRPPHPQGADAPAQAALGVLCLIDLDDFKHVNDTCGHEAGDALLKEVGTRMVAAVGTSGAVARSGGDEFVLLLPAGAPPPGQVLDAVFTDPFVVGGEPRRVAASGGATTLHPTSQLSTALADADVALYAAKGDGGGRVVDFQPAQRDVVLGRHALLADLRQALAGEVRGGRLEVHYQLLVDLADGRAVGCEALVRWNHPSRGWVAPDEFLPLAEQHGLGLVIDRRVLREALRQVADWDAVGAPRVEVSVNLGRSSMLAPDLADDVLSALRETGLEAGRLHLEITEHEELPLGEGAAALVQLTAAGVRVALDDFGVGYTCLDYLRRYPVHVLKLDRSLTRPLQEEDTSPLVAGIVSLARTLGILVLAEGVETEVQLQRLVALGIDLGQGYHLARPAPAPDVLALLRARAGGDGSGSGEERDAPAPVAAVAVAS